MRRKKGKRLRLGLKYCGGCNPEYDRVALVEDLANRLGSKIEFVSPHSRDVDFILAVEGCATACADLSPFEGLVIRIITAPEQAEALVREITGGDDPSGA